MRLSAVRPIGVLLAAAALAGCASGGATPSSAVPLDTSLAPAMTIERFLRAANQSDLDTMAQLFGTRDGAVARAWTKQEVDDRMLLLANVLRHSDYTIAGEQVVAGRRDEATRLNVQMVIGGDTFVVPFTLVRTGARNWLIEEIGIDRVTRGADRRGTGA